MSAQKARLVADQIRGKPVEEALNVLAFSDKKAAPLIRKLLNSAIANAEHNEGADVDDLRESPALDIIGLLAEKGALVDYHDPHIPAFDHDGLSMASVPSLMDAVRAADCVAIITDHTVTMAFMCAFS